VRREGVDFPMCGIFADAHDVGLFELPGVLCEQGLWRGDRGCAYVQRDPAEEAPGLIIKQNFLKYSVK
jgi:hypothetical protein